MASHVGFATLLQERWSKEVTDYGFSAAAAAPCTFFGSVKMYFKMLISHKTVCLAGISLIAWYYLRKYRRENELLRLMLDDEMAVSRASRALMSELKEERAVYGYATMERLEERTLWQIKYINMALESMPNYYSNYEILKKKLDKLHDLKRRIDATKSDYEWQFSLSRTSRLYRLERDHLLSHLLRDIPSSQCPFEDFLCDPPVQSTFWSNGSNSQKRKLEREYSRLTNAFPNIAETKLRAAMVYVYSHLKRDIFSVSSNKLESMVRRLVMESGGENTGNWEEPELCSICLEEMNNNQIVSLNCNHLFHRQCINPWLEQDRRCPLCRSHVVGTSRGRN